MRRVSLAALALTLFFVLKPAPAGAQDEASDYFKFMAEEARTTSLATGQRQPMSRAPAVGTVITASDIEAYGARDLADILRNVPGFEFGVDVSGIVGLDVRGIWAHEGKVLLMINGLTLNDLAFGNYNFFGSIPASIISRVEILRGPGSALYGGFAEVAVINVITRQADDLHGMRLRGDAGSYGAGGSSRHANVSYGTNHDNLRMSAHIGYGEQPLSQRRYTDFFGNSVKFSADNAVRRWRHLITDASIKNLTLQYQRLSFTFGGQDGFSVLQAPVNGINAERQNNYSEALLAKYRYQAGSGLSIEPRAEYYRGNTIGTAVFPTSISGTNAGPGATLWRYHGQVTATCDVWNAAQATAGAGYQLDAIENISSDGTPGLQNSADPKDLTTKKKRSSYFGLLQFVQGWRDFDLTAGARYEDTSFGRAFAPRAGLTYQLGDFNAKLLYGRAFRIPLLWQAFSKDVGFGGNLHPETADTEELELGYQFTPQWTGKFNAFFIDIVDPIVYNGKTNTYTNFGEIQSKGFEAELQARYGRYGGFANAAFAAPGPKTSSGFTTQSKGQFLAAPPLKLNLGTYYRAGMFEWAPSVTFLSHRAGQSRDSAAAPNGRLGTTDYKALVLANLNISAHDVVKDLDIHLSIHNIFDARYLLIQPYYGAHAPLPAQDREITLGVTWHL